MIKTQIINATKAQVIHQESWPEVIYDVYTIERWFDGKFRCNRGFQGFEWDTLHQAYAFVEEFVRNHSD